MNIQYKISLIQIFFFYYIFLDFQFLEFLKYILIDFCLFVLFFFLVIEDIHVVDIENAFLFYFIGMMYQECMG